MSKDLGATAPQWTKHDYNIVSAEYRGYLVSTYFSGIHWNAWIKDSADVIVNMKIRSGEETARRLALAVVDSLGDSMSPYNDAPR